MDYLVIGYGNSLRSDDGAGQLVAEAVAEWGLATVRSLARHQLTPELAADLADADAVIFVDAVVAFDQPEAQVQVEPLAPRHQRDTLGHAVDPRSLLSLTQTLYDKTPRAYRILIPAFSFAFGEALSPTTQARVEQALEKIRALVGVL